jgi:FkbM family methyltransferase
MKRLLKSALGLLGYRVQGVRYCPRQLLEPACCRAVEFDDLVCRRMFECGPELTFIQVGAFDGITRDPLRKYIDKCGWRGVLVEPQARAANQLRELYDRDDRVVVLEAALDREFGTRTLFTVESKTAPAWAGGLASFNRETIIKHSDLIPGLPAMIREETIDCITFEEVLSRLPSARIDLLQIDTEGADANILSLFPFDRVRPAIIHWEVKHLSKFQQEETFEMLCRRRYRLARSGAEDMLAVLDGPKGAC